MLKSKDAVKKTDNDLVALSLIDKENYLHLMRRYEAKLLRYIYRLTNANNQDAEDILQDIFIKTYQNLNDFDPKLKFSSWIYRISHNTIISHWRKTKVDPKTVELFDNLDVPASSAPIYKELEIKLNKGKIIEIFNHMPIKYRNVLVLRYYEDKQYQEISDILRVPIGTVATLISRAKKSFKKTAKLRKINF